MRVASGWCLGLGLAGLAPSAGCSTAQVLHSPEENATARVSGHPAAYWRVPPRAPHGDVRVATLGIATLQPQGDEDDHLHAMHVRMVVADDDDRGPWQIDTREQIGVLDGYGQSRPAFADASIGRAPIVTIAPRTSATVDLYYPLPESMQKASGVPHFELLWRVHTQETPVAERTSFDRLRIEPPAPTGYHAHDGEWGPSWYDPFWPDYTYWGAPVLGPAYHQRPVVQGSLPPPAVRIR